MVKGLASLNRKMNHKIPDRVRQLARQQLAVWADKIVDSMHGFVPQRTGALFASIGWVWGDQIPSGAFSVGTVAASDPDMVITIFAGSDEAYWARWQEFGTVNHSPSPYFFPAVRLNNKTGRARVRRAIRKGIREGAA